MLCSQPLEVFFAQIELSSLLLSLPSTKHECKLVMPITIISFSISRSSPTASIPSNAQTAKKFRVRRTILSLSSKPVPWSDWWDSASVFTMLFPGRWCMMKSNQAKSRAHLACLRLSFLAVMKYCRFVWSIQISQQCSTPSTKCLYSSNTLTVRGHSC